MLFTNLPLLLLATIGFASVTTAYSSPEYEPSARSIRIIPRQAQNQRFRGGNRNQNNAANQNKNQNNAANQNKNNGANNAANKNGNNNNAGNANGGGNNNGGNNNGGNANLQLDPKNVQAASAATGQAGGGDPDQANSATDNANFINFCSGKTITNGAQVKGGSCNGIVMGDIPAQNKMVSSIIVNPAPGQDIAANKAFDITVQVANLAAGSFTNPQNTYYAAPQALKGGIIVGHTHVTVQDLGNSLTPNQPPDATKFAFFKGINDAGNGNGLLKATVDQGLPAGNYRVCTMSSSSNHQPVLMPVAQRGAQDDCTKFTVGQGGGNNGGNNNNGAANNGGNNNNNNNNNNANKNGAAAGGAAAGGNKAGNAASGGAKKATGGRTGARGGRRRGGNFGAGFRGFF